MVLASSSLIEVATPARCTTVTPLWCPASSCRSDSKFLCVNSLRTSISISFSAKYARMEEALQQTKEEAERATSEAQRAKADAQTARESEAAAKRKLADAEAARTAAEKACHNSDAVGSRCEVAEVVGTARSKSLSAFGLPAASKSSKLTSWTRPPR
jgi:hypothetical protein